MNKDNLKKLAAYNAVEEIEDGMIVGLGTGSTVQFALEKIAEKIKSGELENIVGIPTSLQTERETKRLGIPITSLNEELRRKNEDLKSSSNSPQSSFVVDLTIDGADEVDKDLNLIKGGGGALLKEKIVAQASKKLIIIIDESKLSGKLGEKFYLPVEVIKDAYILEKNFLEGLGAKVKLRMKSDGEHFITDEGNYILDAKFNVIDNPAELNNMLNGRAAIVEHGIFKKELVSKVIVAAERGIEIYEKS